MKHSRTILCGLIMAAVLLASAALADPNAPCPKGKGPGPGTWMQEKLGLTDEQAEQLQQLRTAHQEEMKNIHQLKKEKREALQEAVRSGADEQAIRAAAAELGTALGDAAVLRAAHIAKVKEVLTEEQLEKWQELKEECKEHRGKKCGPGAWGKGKSCKMEGKPGCPMAAEGKPECPMGKEPQGRWRQRGRWGQRGRRGHWGPPDANQIIEMKDTDDDGKLTLEEFTATKWPSPEESFEKADTNGDGFLTSEEFEESMKQFMERKGGPR